jgi:predicted nucleotidyltransferase
MIHLDEKYLNIIREVLAGHLEDRPKVYVYGSRVKERWKQYSDIDLAIEKSLSFNEKSELKNAFSESMLPIFVDILSIPDTKESFLKLIKNDFVELKY